MTGRALDIGIFNKKGELLGHANDYKEIGKILKEINDPEIIWGGDFDTGKPQYTGGGWDSGHIEYHPGYTSTQHKQFMKSKEYFTYQDYLKKQSEE